MFRCTGVAQPLAANLGDRLVFGGVRDHLVTTWAIWNLADLAVLLGRFGYAWLRLFTE